MVTKNRKANKVWTRIFPLRIGDRVRYVRNLGRQKPRPADKHLGEIGKIVAFVEDEWKEKMVYQWGNYPRTILKETMFTVAFSINDSWYAFRREEIEVVED